MKGDPTNKTVNILYLHEKIKNNDHRLSCRISHFSNYYQPSKLLAGGSNPPGRAMERSGGYMHARVYPPFFIPHNRSGHSLVADFQTLVLGHGPHMRME